MNQFINLPTSHFFPTDPLECKVTEWGWEYVGSKNRTVDGLPCLPWNIANSSQLEYKNETIRDDAVAEGHNFCRSVMETPKEGQGPYCIHALEYELEPYDNMNVDVCDIPFCSLKFKPTK